MSFVADSIKFGTASRLFGTIPARRNVVFLANNDGTARQITFVVPDGVYALTNLNLYGPGGSTGGGSALGGNVSGGGGGGSGEVIEGATLSVTPGEIIAVQIGASGAYGVVETEAGAGSDTYIKRGAHSAVAYAKNGAMNLFCRAGNTGQRGTAAKAGDGAAARGPLFPGGSTPPGGVGPSSEAGGGGGTSQDTLPARFLPFRTVPMNGGGAGAGGYAVSGSTTQRNGGAPGLALGNFTSGCGASTGQASPSLPGGGSAPPAPTTAVIHRTATVGGGINGGSFFAAGLGTQAIQGDGQAGICPAQGASGAGAGAYGNRGGDGMVAFEMVCSEADLAAMPPTEVFYSGAGRTVPATFVGVHMGYSRACTLTGNVGTGEITRVGSGILSPGYYQFQFTGTPPSPFVLGTTYYFEVKVGGNSFFARESVFGTDIPATTTGSGGSTFVTDVTPGPDWACGMRRMYDNREFMWRGIDPLSADFNATNLALFDAYVADCVGRGEAVMYTLSRTPTYAVASTSPAAALTLSSSATGGATATAGSGIFTAASVGKWINSGGGRAMITGFTSTTVVSIQTTVAFAGTAIASGAWTLGPSGLVNNWGDVNGADAPTSVGVQNFVAWLLTRYNTTMFPQQKPITYIEVWNEPSILTTSVAHEFRGTLENLAEVARGIASGISTAGFTREQVKILAPAWSAGFNVRWSINKGGWLHGFLTASDGAGGVGSDHIDGVSLHPYNFVGDINAKPQETTFQDSIKRLDHDVRRCIRQAGVADWETLPIHASEWGMDRFLEDYPWLSCSRTLALTYGEHAARGWASSIMYAWSFADFGRNLCVDYDAQKALGDMHRSLAGRTFTRAERLQDTSIRFTLVGGSMIVFGK